jgi:hypothetical protein
LIGNIIFLIIIEMPIGLALKFTHLPFHSARYAEQGDQKIKNDLIDTVGYYGPDDIADHNIIKVAIGAFKLVKDLQKACRQPVAHWPVAHRAVSHWKVGEFLKTGFGIIMPFALPLTRQKDKQERERKRSLLYFPYDK